MQTDKLISRIKAVLDDSSGRFEAQALAIEYADLMMHVRDRLEQCVALIRTGNDFAALQVAESAPPLLDLAAKLSFGESLRWLDFCRERSLPYPARPNMAHVDLVNGLYGRKINESHPLYRDYRQAIREHDDLRALEVLMSILRVNPADENAQEEFVRLGAQNRSKQLKKLEALLAAGAEAEVCALVEQLERVNVPGLTLSPIFQRACVLQEERARAAAERETAQLWEEMMPLQAAECWERLIPLLVRYRTLEREHRLVLPEAQAREVEQLERRAEEWQRAETAALQREENVRELTRVLECAVQTPRVLHLKRMPSKRLAALLGEALAQAPAFAGELDAGLVESAQRLRHALLRRIQRRDAALASAVAVSLALCVTAGVLSYGYRLDQENRMLAEEEAEELLARGDLYPAEEFLRKVQKRWDNVETVFAIKRELTMWTQRTRGRLEECKSHLMELQSMDPATATVSDYMGGLLALKEWEAALAMLPADTRAETTSLYAGALGRLEVIRTRLAGEKTPPFSQAMSALGNRLDLAVAQPKLPARVTALVALQPEWNQLLAEGTLIKPVLEKEDAERWEAFSQRVEETLRFWQEAAHIESLLSGAVSLDTYFTMLKSESGSTNALVRSVIENEALLRDPPAALFRPQALQLWRLAGRPDEAWDGVLFLPEETVPTEAVAAGKLTQNSLLQQLWRYRYQAGETEPRLPAEVFTVGEVRTTRHPFANGFELRQEAEVLKENGTEEVLQLSWRQFGRGTPRGECLADGAQTAESIFFAQMKRFYEPEAGKIMEPLLLTMDRVRRAPRVSPLFKAYLLQELTKVAEDRAEEWGVLFSPTAQRDLAMLRQLLEESPLGPLDWMNAEKWSGAVSQLERMFIWQKYSYQEEAEAYWRMMRALREPGFAFIGYVNSDGKFLSVGTKPVTGNVVVLSRKGRLMVLPAERMNAPEPEESKAVSDGYFASMQAAPYSPVLMLPKTPQEAATEANIPEWVATPLGGWDAYVFLSSQRENWYKQAYEQWERLLKPKPE